jgi:hypothetical protein
MSQLVKLILKILNDLELLRGLSNQKTLYSTRSCVNWAFLGTRGLLKRSFHSRFKMAHTCQKWPNLHTNSSNKLLMCTIILFRVIHEKGISEFLFAATHYTHCNNILISNFENNYN